MTTQENIQLVQNAYAAFGRGDIQFILDRLAPNVDWLGVVGVGPNVPTGGLRVGPAQVATFFQQLAESTDFKVFEPREFFAANDKVVALGFYEAVVKKTGRTYKSEFAMVFTLSSGRVTRMREYADSLGITAAY